jgi:uncharacterized PurR-regulated membrane protein YhhQ (DUF165 family)
VNLYVVAYLIAILAANFTLLWFGRLALYINAFLFIGLDLTARDRLHEAWHHQHLLPKMAALIASGSALTWTLNRNATQIAVASMIAFAAAAVADALVYQRLHHKPLLRKINASNLASAGVDSLVFPTLAFGALDLVTTALQFVTKVAGGFFWSLIIAKET